MPRGRVSDRAHDKTHLTQIATTRNQVKEINEKLYCDRTNKTGQNPSLRLKKGQKDRMTDECCGTKKGTKMRQLT